MATWLTIRRPGHSVSGWYEWDGESWIAADEPEWSQEDQDAADTDRRRHEQIEDNLTGDLYR